MLWGGEQNGFSWREKQTLPPHALAPTTVGTLKVGLHFIPSLRVIHKDSEVRIQTSCITLDK